MSISSHVAVGIPAHTQGYHLAARGSARYHEPDVGSTVMRPADQSRDLVMGQSDQLQQLSEDSLLALRNHAEREATTVWVWAGWIVRHLPLCVGWQRPVITYTLGGRLHYAS